MSKSKRVLSLLLSAIVLSVSGAAAHNVEYLAGKQKVQRSPVEFGSSRLTSNIELPYLPAYTGVSKFETGTVFPNADGGASYCIKVLAREQRPEVLSWYASALQQYGWKPIKSLISARSVGGMRKGLVVHICIRPASGEYRSSIYIQYKLGKSGGGA